MTVPLHEPQLPHTPKDYVDDILAQIDVDTADAEAKRKEAVTRNEGGKALLTNLRKQGYVLIKAADLTALEKLVADFDKQTAPE